MVSNVSHKSQRIAVLIDSLQGGPFDAHYLGYFECFNQQLFFEAHEVLEELWLARRAQPSDLFYKGLIQLAGAFVHIQKQRPKPALALFRLAACNLSQYPGVYQSLDVDQLQRRISDWMVDVQAGIRFGHPLGTGRWPTLLLKKP